MEFDILKLEIANAKKKVNQAFTTKRSTLYAAIDILLSKSAEKKELFFSFKIDSSDNALKNQMLFNDFFKYPECIATSSFFKEGNAEKIILTALAFIGLNFSGKNKKEETDYIRNQLKKEKHYSFSQIKHIFKKIDTVFANFNSSNQGIEFIDEFKNNTYWHHDYNSLNDILKSLGLGLGLDKTPFKLYYIIDPSPDNVIFMSFLILGIYTILQQPKYTKESTHTTQEPLVKSESSEVKPYKPETKPVAIKKPIPAIMAVVIPANKLGSETKESMIIPSTDAIRFIDAAVYFACFPMDTAKEIEKELDLKEDHILLDSAQDIYVSLETEDGHDLTGVSLKFSLKKSLKNKPREFRITKIRLLDKLRGLDKFNRI